MKSIRGVLSILVALTAGLALAAEPSSSTSMQQMSSAMMKERAEMAKQATDIDTHLAAAEKSVSSMEGEKAKALDAQLVALQKEVRALQSQLAATPQYIPNAHQNKNRP